MRAAMLNGIGTRLAAGMLICVLPALARGEGVVTDTTAASLRAAMAGGGTVYFATTGTVMVAGTIAIFNDVSLIDSNHSVMITGSGPRGQGPLLRVSAGAEFRATGLAFANGSGTNGGAIYSAGTLILTDCLFSNNTAVGTSGAQGTSGLFGSVLGTPGGNGKPGLAAGGGAVYSIGTAIVAGCTFLTNQAIGGTGGTGGTGGNSAYQGGDGGSGSTGGSAAGGALYSTGVLQVSNTLFRFNSARGGNGGAGGTNGAAPFPGASGDGEAGSSALGGALFVDSGTISDCTFHSNSATAGNTADAAADTSHFIGVEGKRGPVAYGGGVYAGGSVTLVNCTFSTNSVAGGKGGQGGNGNPYSGNGGDGGDALGGSIYAGAGATLQVTNCTVAGGVAVPGAGGLRGRGLSAQAGAPGAPRGANVANAGSSTLKNTILAYPTNSVNVYGAIVDGLGNLSSDDTPPNVAESRRNLDPLLLPLAYNGGPTPTMAPRTVSPAVNTGDGEGVPPTDQRGYPRDGVCDVGAVELQLSVTPTLSAASSKNQLLLSWPATASHYSVWSGRNLPSSLWRPVTNTVRAVGDVLTVTVPVTPTNRMELFRLELK